ncbi:reticulophagy regulator 3 [Trichomycterus rosablanca]|uniref:reticulophagy regulator 3 n=1 Tax=Trichomycterus rosablanca TaxID=2290929 RepID=UPI002F360CCD
MAQGRGAEDVDCGTETVLMRGSGGRRESQAERARQVRAVRAVLMDAVGPHERLITYLQAALLWKRPVHGVFIITAVNCVFWFFALSSFRPLFLLASGLALAVCVDTWRNKIWPKIKVRRQDESENESWGLVQPDTLSVPELCHFVAEMWVDVASCAADLTQFKQKNPGTFCVLTCGLFSLLAMVGRYVPGIVLSYVGLWGVLSCPLAVYYQMWQRACVRLEPALQWLDFSVKGYMMSKPIDNQFLRQPIRGASGDGSDSEEELAAFCPTFDEVAVAKELAMTDSEHSDAEVSYTENGTFNLSRGQTPLTEGSEDMDRHSDPEESFAQDLDFPSINPDATLLDDDDDPSLGLPSLGSAAFSGSRAPTTSAMLDLDTQLDSDQDDLDTDLSLGGLNLTSDITGDLAGLLASNMIQAAISGAFQAPRGHRKQSSSELDLDLDLDPDQDDFEMLDQSELNHMDPLGGGGGRGAGQNRSQGSSFLSNLLGKPQ